MCRIQIKIRHGFPIIYGFDHMKMKEKRRRKELWNSGAAHLAEFSEKENKPWSTSPQAGRILEPSTRMFGLQNDFAAPAAILPNCPRDNYRNPLFSHFGKKIKN